MADAITPPNVPHVLVAMNKVMRAIGKEGITKDRTGPSQQGSYKFRGIDDVYNALNPLMAQHQLLMVPSKIRPEYHTVPNSKNGGVIVYCRAVVTFTLWSAEDGSSTTAETMGEGMDSSDKASNKALSGAMKYASLMVFMIPTEGESQDSETGNLSPDYREFQRSGQYRDPEPGQPRQRPRSPEDDFPGERRSNSQQADPRQNGQGGSNPGPGRQSQGHAAQGRQNGGNGPSGQKNSAQAKRDGDWEVLEKIFALQRTEEELLACVADGTECDKILKAAPFKWKTPMRDLYAWHLDRVRHADADRYADQRLDPRTGESLQREEWAEPGAAT